MPDPNAPRRRAAATVLVALVPFVVAVALLVAVLTPTATPGVVPAAESLPTVFVTPPSADEPSADENGGESGAALVPDRCAGVRGRVVLVDISEQRLWTCASRATVMTTAVTTGADGMATPVGRWRVYAKERNRWLSGEGYSRFVDRWMPYSGGIGFHDSSWQVFPYGSEQFHDDGSHGCVHVPRSAMKRLYRWADVGTQVHVVR